MLAHHFIKWAASAPVGQRSAAANALARAYLQSRFGREEIPMVETALTILLDDPSPRVRGAIAAPLSLCRNAPAHVIAALADDEPEVSATILMRSELIDERQLADLVARRGSAIQRLIAGRANLGAHVTAALAEHGDFEAVRRMLDNPTAAISEPVFLRIAERFGSNAQMRSVLLAHARLPAGVRHELIRRLSRILCGSPLAAGRTGDSRAELLAQESLRAAALQLIDQTSEREYPALAEQLQTGGQLTAGLLVELLAACRLSFFFAAMAALSGLPGRRVRAILARGNDLVVRALMHRAALPEALRLVAMVAIRLWRREQEGQASVGPQEASLQMLHAIGGETDELAAQIAGLLRAIHDGNLRADGRAHAQAIIAARSDI